jgi:Arc/MetJ-type ribon-helix-helix transcriptional regulator
MAQSKVGKPTGEMTKAGRPVYKTSEGESVSEKSVTIPIDGKWVNAPSIWNGRRINEDGVERLLREGFIKPTSVHNTRKEAEKAAEERSKGLMNKKQNSPTFNEGGIVKKENTMKTKQQTRKLLEEGGMLDEGGTTDPESGNEVPAGSLQKEVRDDIPAQLSEGEFVFPADVVRFIGLERLMQMRQAAKRGLAKMNDMGQMGNSEEATMDDGEDTEFETEIDDILADVEAKAETPQ